MAKITDIHALEVLDSQGNPTIMTTVTIDNLFVKSSLVPSGTSVGDKEALELRDNDQKRYLGKGVLKAVNNVNNSIYNLLINQEVNSLDEIDQKMINLDGTDNKEKLGANSILSVSLALAKSLADYYNLPLYQFLGGHFKNKIPVPMMNILNGGRHSSNNIDFQEYMIVPFAFSSFKEALQAASEIFHTLKTNLEKQGYSSAVGLEGGFAPSLKDNEEPLKLIIEAIIDAGYVPGNEIAIALDVASSEFYDKEKNIYKLNNQEKTSQELIEYYQYLIDKYPIVSIEDGLDQNDINGWILLTQKLKDKILLIGDDLFVTNKKLLQKGIDQKYANGVLIKLNQIGTLSETIQTIDLAIENNYTPIVSHRSGDTEDTFIADLSVALSCPLIKTGSLSRSERIAKYNRLLVIEEQMNSTNTLNNKKINELMKNNCWHYKSSIPFSKQ